MVKPDQAPAPPFDAEPENPPARAFLHQGRHTPSLGRQNPPLGQKRPSPLPAVEPLTEKITVELPTYLSAAVRREGTERRITTRTLVMMGLQALGFEVHEEDLIPDGRRTRSRGTR